MHPEPPPRVSVCLLTYNRALSLPATLDSLLAQSHKDFELIINDDRSPDNTEEVCRDYESRDSRVRYFKNSVNLRYAGNQNAALLRASCNLVAIVHDGDIYRSDLLEKWINALVAHPTAALVFNSLEQMDEQGQVVNTYRHPYGPLVEGITLFDEMIRRPGSPIFGIVMVRKSCVLSVGPFDPRIPTLADVDMWFRLLLRFDAAYIGEPLLRIAPREQNHHNNPSNWRIRKEHELIYVLNSRRRYLGQALETRSLQREIRPMIWRMRFRSLLHCLWHRRLYALTEGLAFMGRNLNFAKITAPDHVIHWDDVRL